ncbi:MAG: GDSL-type esterase/lipase family protein [Planctomycetota bacterium]
MQKPSRRLSLASLLLGFVLITLVWTDVLPGGWTLRSWLTPPTQMKALVVARHRKERLALFQGEPTPAPGAIVFLGSSTIERFPLARSFPGRPCLDRGIGSEDLNGLSQRLEASLPPEPAGIVLYAASIDFRRGAPRPGDLVARIEELLDRLQDLAPDVPVALIGILPERDMMPALGRRLAITNNLLEKVCLPRGVAFVSIDRAPLITEAGDLTYSHSADRLHLNELGYRQLATWILEDGGALAALLK